MLITKAYIKFLSYVIIVPIFIFSNFYAQDKDSIRLPNVSHSELFNNFSDENDIIDIHITRNHELFINKKRIFYWDNIVPTIINIDRGNNPSQVYLSKIFFHIDKDAKYRFVDRVKEEVARTPKKLFFYKVNSEEKNHYLISKVFGTIEKDWPLERIKTRENEFDSVFVMKLHLPNWMKDSLMESPTQKQLEIEFCRQLYYGNEKEISSFLKILKTTFITLLPDGKFRFENQTYDLKELGVLSEKVKLNYFVLVRFDFELEYSTYIGFLAAKKTFLKNLRPYSANTSPLIEVSYGLEKKLREYKIEVF